MNFLREKTKTKKKQNGRNVSKEMSSANKGEGTHNPLIKIVQQ